MADVIKEIVIDRFDGGISNDVRQQLKNEFAVASMFDIWSNPARLTPIRSLEEDTNSDAIEAYDVRDFWVGQEDGNFYALGRQSGFFRPKIIYKTGGDVPAGTWTIPASSEGGAVLIRGCFLQWAGALWMFSGTTNVSKCIPGTSFTDTVASVGSSIASVAQGIISPTDNNMYMFYYETTNKKSHVVKVDSSGSVTDDVLPLPRGYIIKSACLWGNYIALGLSIGTSTFKSVVILWDPTLSNFSEVIDFGDGEIKVLENLEGSLTAIVDNGMSTSLSVTGGTLEIKMWAGGSVQTVKSIKMTTTISSGIFGQHKELKNNRVYFRARMDFNGSTYRGVWGFGRKGPGQPFALTLAVTDSSVTSNEVNAFGLYGDYWFLTINGDGTVLKTNDQSVNGSGYLQTSYIESQKYNGGNEHRRKLLHSVFVTTVPLPDSSQLLVKYRKDEETSYSSAIITHDTDNEIHFEISAASGTSLPEFKEIQFKLESTRFAEIISWGFRYIELDGATTPDS